MSAPNSSRPTFAARTTANRMTNNLGRETTSIRRFTLGSLHVIHVARPDYHEFHVSANAPQQTAEAATTDAATLYGDMAAFLQEKGATVVQERLYGALRVQAEVDAARATAVEGCSSFSSVPPTYVEGMPAGASGLAGLHLCAIAGALTELICHTQRAVGHRVTTSSAEYLYLSGLRGTTPDVALPAVDQAARMFSLANEVLQGLGFTYRDVVRTWIYLTDILAWYDEFNQARNRAYTAFGLLGRGEDYLPASTGIQARSPGYVELTMDLMAVRPTAQSDLHIERLHNPLQNEACTYGSAFARAMEVRTGGARTVYVSGTASIDEYGKTVHANDIEGQITRTITNIEALIGTRGLTLQDIAQATVFLKDPAYVEPFQRLCKGTPFADLGVAMLADICRPDLLFEIDAVATGLA